jgi:hypothetical protein
MESDAKIEQFVLLAGSTRGLALVELIKRATSEPGLFAFGELIDLPAIQEVMASAADVSTCNQPQHHRSSMENMHSIIHCSNSLHSAAGQITKVTCNWALTMQPAPPPRTANKEQFPSLSDAQTNKLKQLTVVSLATAQKVWITSHHTPP